MTHGQAKRDALRRKIHEAALKNAPFDGWTEGALLRAGRDAGFGHDAVRRAFPDGVRDLLDFHLREADAKTIEAMKRARVDRMNSARRVAFALRARLEAATAHREASRRALIALAMPSNAAVAARGLARTVDAIWRAAGDRSTDFSFYTKRATLAAIYAATLLYWLDDESEGHRDSWAFLGRRLDGVANVGRLRKRAEDALDALKTGGPFLARLLRRAA